MLKTHAWVFPRNPLVADQYFKSILKIRTSISKTISPSYSSVHDEFNDTHEAIVRKFEHEVRKFGHQVQKFEHHFRKQYGHRIRHQISLHFDTHEAMYGNFS